MAYTTIDDPTIYFNTKLYTGNGGTQSITGVGFQPDWVWIKNRQQALNFMMWDSVRGTTKYFYSNLNEAEGTSSSIFTSFDSDGFTVGNNNNVNQSSNNIVAWNWSAGGSAPAITYTVKVVSDSGNKYRFDDFGTSAVTLDLQEGGTYTFDQSDSSNSGHPLRFSTTSNGTHGGGSEYTTGVTTTGTPGSAGAKTVITVAASAPTLYYYCTQHSGMGGQANTNSTFGSSNFSGSVQTTVSANVSAGFSLVSYQGTGSVGTFGHGLGVAPKAIIIKQRSIADGWVVFFPTLDITLALHSTIANNHSSKFSSFFNSTDPTNTLISLGTDDQTNKSSATNIAYCFAEKKGYSKFGSYTGNGNADGTFVFCGFRPAVIITKKSSATANWTIVDNKRLGYNVDNNRLYPNLSDAENTADVLDILSNGFKMRGTQSDNNTSGETYIYMAFAEAPFVNSNGVPCNAR